MHSMYGSISNGYVMNRYEMLNPQDFIGGIHQLDKHLREDKRQFIQLTIPDRMSKFLLQCILALVFLEVGSRH